MSTTEPTTGANTKIVVAIRSDLATWQKLNVVAFLTSGLATAMPALIGEPYVDASARTYPPMLRYPVRVFGGDAAEVRRAFDRALSRDLLVSVYTDGMFTTMNDADNRAAVAAFATDKLAIAGFVAAGDARQIDKAFDRIKLHP